MFQSSSNWAKVAMTKVTEITRSYHKEHRWYMTINADTNFWHSTTSKSTNPKSKFQPLAVNFSCICHTMTTASPTHYWLHCTALAFRNVIHTGYWGWNAWATGTICCCWYAIGTMGGVISGVPFIIVDCGVPALPSFVAPRADTVTTRIDTCTSSTLHQINISLGTPTANLAFHLHLMSTTWRPKFFMSPCWNSHCLFKCGEHEGQDTLSYAYRYSLMPQHNDNTYWAVLPSEDCLILQVTRSSADADKPSQRV